MGMLPAIPDKRPHESMLAPGSAGLARPAGLGTSPRGFVTRPTDSLCRTRLCFAGGLDVPPRQMSQVPGAPLGWTAADPLRSASEPGSGPPGRWTFTSKRRARPAAQPQAGRRGQSAGWIDAGGMSEGGRRRIRAASGVSLEADPGNGSTQRHGSGHVVRPATHALTQDW